MEPSSSLAPLVRGHIIPTTVKPPSPTTRWEAASGPAGGPRSPTVRGRAWRPITRGRARGPAFNIGPSPKLPFPASTTVSLPGRSPKSGPLPPIVCGPAPVDDPGTSTSIGRSATGQSSSAATPWSGSATKSPGSTTSWSSATGCSSPASAPIAAAGRDELARIPPPLATSPESTVRSRRMSGQALDAWVP